MSLRHKIFCLLKYIPFDSVFDAEFDSDVQILLGALVLTEISKIEPETSENSTFYQN